MHTERALAATSPTAASYPAACIVLYTHPNKRLNCRTPSVKPSVSRCR